MFYIRLHAGPVVKLDSRLVCFGYTAVSGVEKGEDGWPFVSWDDQPASVVNENILPLIRFDAKEIQYASIRVYFRAS